MRTLTTLFALTVLATLMIVLVAAPSASGKSTPLTSSSDVVQTNQSADTLPEPIQQPIQKKFGDFTGDGRVDVNDLLELLSHFGSCPRAADPALMCPWDLNGDYSVDVGDIVVLEYNWN